MVAFGFVESEVLDGESGQDRDGLGYLGRTPKPRRLEYLGRDAQATSVARDGHR
jgi:hypothetical protein